MRLHFPPSQTEIDFAARMVARGETSAYLDHINERKAFHEFTFVSGPEALITMEPRFSYEHLEVVARNEDRQRARRRGGTIAMLRRRSKR